MGRRSLLVIAAIVVAAIGTALVFVYADRARQEGLASAEPVQVLVATDVIPAGTQTAAIVQSGAVELKTLPAGSLPDNAVSDLGGVTGQQTSAGIFPGQVLISNMFAAPDQATALNLPKGTVGISVGLADPNRVAGFVTPGSEVAVFATLSSDGSARTDLLLERAVVVGVGPTTTTTKTTSTEAGTDQEEISKAILTLAVSSDDAKKVAYATETGTLHFALLDESSKVNSSDVASAENIFARG